MITLQQLRAVMPNLAASRATAFIAPLNAAMDRFGIGQTMARTAAFLAQLAHESGELRWMEEIWGPTAAQRRYEPPSEVARRLGNTQPGDGFRYKGRGPIQLTGRANYKTFGEALGLDLVANPEQAAQPEVGFLIAALYWQRRGLNDLADQGNFREITRRINGGFNGLEDRERHHARTLAVLARGFQPSGAMPRGGLPTGRALDRGADRLGEMRTEQRQAAARKAAATRAANRAEAGSGAAKKAPKKKAPTKKAPTKKTSAKKAAAKRAPAAKAPPRKTAAPTRR